MILRPPRLLFTLGLVGFLSWGSPGAAPPESSLSSNHVADEIDKIVDGPEYDWLREEGAPASGAENDLPGDTIPPRKSRFVQTDPQSGGCGYQMGPPIEKKRAKRKSCDNDTPGSCENNSIGDCGFNPQGGSCGSFSIGSAPASFGYVLGALLLAGLLAFIIWSVKRAAKRSDNEKTRRPKKEKKSAEISLAQATKIPAEKLLLQAREAAQLGNYKAAIGLAYLASLSFLHMKGQVNLSSSTTNIEIVTAVRKNGGPYQATESIISVFEEIFFGGREPTVSHWDTCHSLIEGHFVQQ